MEINTVLKRPVSTEKAIKMMEADNKMVFIVRKKATKSEIKQAFESAFSAKVTKVNTLITPQGHKKAFITLSPEKPALDIATQLGLM
ncbi:MAG: 50S ribosomal protein L23 [archaeon]